MDKDKLLDELSKKANEYNLQRLKGSRRVIVTTHDYICRCGDCWYNFGGKEEIQKAEEETRCREGIHDLVRLGDSLWWCQACGHAQENNIALDLDFKKLL